MQEKNQDVGEWDDGEGRLENITAGSLFLLSLCVKFSPIPLYLPKTLL